MVRAVIEWMYHPDGSVILMAHQVRIKHFHAVITGNYISLWYEKGSERQIFWAYFGHFGASMTLQV